MRGEMLLEVEKRSKAELRDIPGRCETGLGELGPE